MKWRISRFCGDIFIIHDEKGHEICKVPNQKMKEYLERIKELADKAESQQ